MQLRDWSVDGVERRNKVRFIGAVGCHTPCRTVVRRQGIRIDLRAQLTSIPRATSVVVGIAVIVTNFVPVTVSTRIGCLVLQKLDQSVEEHSNNSSKERSDPIDPVVVVEVPENNVRANGSSRIE